MAHIGELPQCRGDVVPATLVFEAPANQTGDEGAAAPRANPTVKVGHQFVIQGYVQTYVCKLAHKEIRTVQRLSGCPTLETALLIHVAGPIKGLWRDSEHRGMNRPITGGVACGYDSS